MSTQSTSKASPASHMKHLTLGTIGGCLVAISASAFGWGAIAQSNDGYYGLAVGTATRHDAAYRAMQFCAHHGCGIRQEFRGQCAAIAIGIQDPTRWWYWIGPGENRARSESYRECRNGLGGAPCKVLVAACD